MLYENLLIHVFISEVISCVEEDLKKKEILKCKNTVCLHRFALSSSYEDN